MLFVFFNCLTNRLESLDRQITQNMSIATSKLNIFDVKPLRLCYMIADCHNVFDF